MSADCPIVSEIYNIGAAGAGRLRRLSTRNRMNGLQKWLVAIGIVAALAFSTVSGPLLRPIIGEWGITGYPRLLLITMADLVVLFGLVWGFSGLSLGTIAARSGLTAPIGWTVVFAVVLFVPAAIACSYLAPLRADATPADFAWQVVGAPFVEELAFRGVALGMLIGFCGWKFLPAALVPAVLFGLAHAAQGHGAMETAGIVAITGLGGLLFGWLFVQWGMNIWPPFAVHAGLNGLFFFYDVGANAIGSWAGNAVRFAVVAAAIGLTLWIVPALRKPADTAVLAKS
jgi:membrane protease YdiL (CAAX protease family)